MKLWNLAARLNTAAVRTSWRMLLLRYNSIFERVIGDGDKERMLTPTSRQSCTKHRYRQNVTVLFFHPTCQKDAFMIYTTAYSFCAYVTAAELQLL